jgi:hypothetical protein
VPGCDLKCSRNYSPFSTFSFTLFISEALLVTDTCFLAKLQDSHWLEVEIFGLFEEQAKQFEAFLVVVYAQW